MFFSRFRPQYLQKCEAEKKTPESSKANPKCRICNRGLVSRGEKEEPVQSLPDDTLGRELLVSRSANLHEKLRGPPDTDGDERDQRLRRILEVRRVRMWYFTALMNNFVFPGDDAMDGRPEQGDLPRLGRGQDALRPAPLSQSGRPVCGTGIAGENNSLNLLPHTLKKYSLLLYRAR